jgi:hypothetical protein
MRYEQNGSISHGNVNCSLNFMLARRIQSARCFIQQQHDRLPASFIKHF